MNNIVNIIKSLEKTIQDMQHQVDELKVIMGGAFVFKVDVLDDSRPKIYYVGGYYEGSIPIGDSLVQNKENALRYHKPEDHHMEVLKWLDNFRHQVVNLTIEEI